MKISFILKSIVAFFAMISLNVFAASTGDSNQSEAVLEMMHITIAQHADFASLISGRDSKVTDSHSDSLALAASKNAFTGTLSANDNQGFKVELKGSNGDFANLDGDGNSLGPDIDYTVSCANITITTTDAPQLGDTALTITSLITDDSPANLAAGTNVKVYDLLDTDGDATSSAKPGAGFKDKDFICKVFPVTSGFNIAHALEGTYKETFTLTLTEGDD